MPKTNSPKILVALLIGLGAMQSGQAIAAATLSMTVLGEATAESATNSFGPTSSTAYVFDQANSNNGASSASAYAWGNDHGTYRSDSSGSGPDFSSSATFQQTYTITNNLGSAASYSLDFFIYYGSMSAYGIGSGHASYDLSIKKNNTNTLFASSATIDSNGGLATTGTALDNATQSGSSYYWDGTTVTLDLGVLAAGDSMTLDYDLVTTAFGAYDADSCDGGYGGYGGYGGDGGDLVPLVIGGLGCMSQAALGDPGEISADTLPPDTGLGGPFSLTATELQNTVPEPGTLALLGLGLGAIGYGRRRRTL